MELSEYLKSSRKEKLKLPNEIETKKIKDTKKIKIDVIKFWRLVENLIKLK